MFTKNGFSEKKLLNLSLILLIITLLELLLVARLSSMAIAVSAILIVLYTIKMMLIYKMTPTITSPFLFPTAMILFWYVGGNYLNVVSYKYASKDHEQLIALLISVSYASYLVGSISGLFIPSIKVKRRLPYIKKSSLCNMLYVISVISFIGAAFYVFPIVNAIISGSYYENRIDMIFNRGYLQTLSSLHLYAIPSIVVMKLSAKKRINTFDKSLVFTSLGLTLVQLHRGPILTMLIMFLFIYNDLYKKVDLKKASALMFVFIILFGIIFPIIRGSSQTPVSIIYNEIGVHTWNLSRYINLTHAVGVFQFKPITMALMIPLPGHQESFEIWIKPLSDILVSVGGASMTLIGEGYMEFKWTGVVVNFFIFGILLMTLFKQRQFTPWGYMVYTYFLNRSESIIQFGFSKVLLTIVIAVTLFTLFNQYNFKMVGNPVNRYPPEVIKPKGSSE